MPTYRYICTGCNKTYLEHRSVDDPQWYTRCALCNGEYQQIEE
jgi:putative FmdB family regulatory protein